MDIMTTTMKGRNMDTDGVNMMDSEKFKHFFKNLMKEAVKEENKEYWKG